MKIVRLNILFILCTILLLISCKKDDGELVVDETKLENRKELGLSSEGLLSNATYANITIEFVYATGFRPSQETIDAFRTFLNDRLNKSQITFVETVIAAPQGKPFDINEIKEIEDLNRTLYTTENHIKVFVFFANGVSDKDTTTSVTLGTAYLNTSIVVYEKTLQNLANSSSTIDLTVLETTTLQHEFGHILGLVNLQNDDIHSNHEDTAHLKHCMVEGCLMFFESTNTSRIMAALANKKSVAQLDPLCIADLQAKGGK